MANSSRSRLGRTPRRSQLFGISVVEILIAVSVLGVIVAIAVPMFMGSEADKEKIEKARQDVFVLRDAISDYKTDNGFYPTPAQGFSALVKKPTTAPVPQAWTPGGYLKEVPSDPWGRPYQYMSPGVQGNIDVWSFGADGKMGGTGDNADIGSWM